MVGYDHLLQVFNCQFSSTDYPLLGKFLKEQPLLSVTQYIPEFVILQAKLVQKSICYYKDKKVKDMYISEYLEFIQEGMLHESLIEFILQHDTVRILYREQ